MEDPDSERQQRRSVLAEQGVENHAIAKVACRVRKGNCPAFFLDEFVQGILEIRGSEYPTLLPKASRFATCLYVPDPMSRHQDFVFDHRDRQVSGRVKVCPPNGFGRPSLPNGD